MCLSLNWSHFLEHVGRLRQGARCDAWDKTTDTGLPITVRVEVLVRGTNSHGHPDCNTIFVCFVVLMPTSAMQMTTMLVGEGAKLDVHGCKTVDMASSFGKALLEFVFIVFACITLLIGINAAKSKAAGRVLFPATFVTGIASISYFSMASGGGWVIAPDCRQLFVARYLDWLITTPLLLIDLGIVAGVSRWDIMALCLSDSAYPSFEKPSTRLILDAVFLKCEAACNKMVVRVLAVTGGLRVSTQFKMICQRSM